MNQKLTYKSKSILLFASLFVALIISYQFAIKKSVQVINSYRNQKKNEQRLLTGIHEIRSLENRNKQLELKTKNLISETDNLRNVVIDKLIPYCSQNNILIINISPTHEYEYERYFFETLSVKFSGKFLDIIKLTYHFEQISHCGKIISIKYYTDYNRETLKKEFYAELFFQNIKGTSH